MPTSQTEHFLQALGSSSFPWPSLRDESCLLQHLTSPIRTLYPLLFSLKDTSITTCLLRVSCLNVLVVLGVFFVVWFFWYFFLFYFFMLPFWIDCLFQNSSHVQLGPAQANSTSCVCVSTVFQTLGVRVFDGFWTRDGECMKAWITEVRQTYRQWGGWV